MSEQIQDPRPHGGKAVVSLVLGIISVFAWIIPLIGVPITVIGLIFGILGIKSNNKKRAIAGIVLSIIFLVATIINASIGAYKGATGTLFTSENQTQDSTPATSSTNTEPAPQQITWNTNELDAIQNGNIQTAVNALQTLDSGKENAVSPAPIDVSKRPWDYYGKIVKITGIVGIVQDYPPNSDFSTVLGGGNAAEIVLVTDDGVYIDYLMAGSSGNIQVGSTVSVYGLPAGMVDAPNELGGTTSQLAIIGKSFDIIY